MALNSPRGTKDFFGNDIKYRNFIINTARQLFFVYNYSEIITPAFEYTEVFSRSIGEGTDIVKKEMYTFLDKKGRSLTLRPEGTASVVRALIENKLYSNHLPVKLFYIGNMFRYERPQKGRMREFWQLGVESIGIGSSVIDAEVIWLLNSFFKQLGFRNLILLINSIGCSKCRVKYILELKKYLKPFKVELCFDCQNRIDSNPLRIFDCKKEGCRKILEDSPKMHSFLCSECKDHFEGVLNFLKILEINYKVNPNLVRGFDYYTKTIFEIISSDIKSAQNALGGGGRYDDLINQFGGPDIPAIGFAIGIDRTLMLMKQQNINFDIKKEGPKVYVIVMDKNYQSFALEVVKFLRDKNFACDINFMIKNLSSELKWAEKNSYNFAVIIGEDEVNTGNITIKDIDKFKQYKINWKSQKNKIIKLIRSKE